MVVKTPFPNPRANPRLHSSIGDPAGALSGYHSSGGNSWKTLRVPAIHCCLSDSK